MLEPIIPKRPGSKKSESADLDNSNSNHVTNSVSPQIPERPLRTSKEELQNKDVPVIPQRPTSKISSDKRLALSEEGGEDADLERSLAATGLSEHGSENGLPKDETISDVANVDSDDVAKIPEIERPTSKHESSNENLNTDRLASIDDAPGATLQEADQAEARVTVGDNPHSIVSNEKSQGDISISDAVEGSSVGNLTDSERSEEDPKVLKSETNKKEETQTNDESMTMPIIPQRPNTTSRLLKSSIEPLSAKETDGEGDTIPSIPKRPAKKDKDNNIDNGPVKLSNSDDSNEINGTEVPTKEILESKSSISSDKETTPSIPSRPSKPSISSKPSVPVRPTKISHSDTIEKSDKPKAPPPKPKKLSSKIAAFQEMLNNPQPSESDSSPPKSNSKSLPNSESNTKAESSSSQKLSSSHMKFAQNLQGIMDRGFALPGMVDPSKISQGGTDTGGLPEDIDKQIETSEEHVPKQEPVRRARGPKGKRLPKNLSTPVNIETAPKFQIVEHNLWNIEFKTASKPDVDDTKPSVESLGRETDSNVEANETVKEYSKPDELNIDSPIEKVTMENSDDISAGLKEAANDSDFKKNENNKMSDIKDMDEAHSDNDVSAEEEDLEEIKGAKDEDNDTETETDAINENFKEPQNEKSFEPITTVADEITEG